MCDEQEWWDHEDEHICVVGVPCDFKSRELVVSELDDWHFHLVVDVGETVSLVVYNEFEDTQSPRCFQFVCVCRGVGACLLKSHLVVWVKHRELKLDVLCIVSYPLSILLLKDVDEVLNVYLSFIVLWVSCPFISNSSVSHVFNLQNATLLQVPLGELTAKLVIWGWLDCVALFWISGVHHGCVTAHFEGAREHDSLVVLSLIASNECQHVACDETDFTDSSCWCMLWKAAPVSAKDWKNVLVCLVDYSSNSIFEEHGSVQLRENFLQWLEHLLAPCDILWVESCLSTAFRRLTSNHGVSCIFKVDTEFICKVSGNLPGLVVKEYHNIMMEVYKLQNAFDVEVWSIGFHCWCHYNDIIIEILVKLLDVYWLGQRSTD